MAAALVLQAGAADAWEPGAHPVLYHVAEWGPWALLAIALALVLRAFVRRRRYRAVAVLDAAAQERVHAAIREVEQKTIGEVVPVVLERSDDHPHARWLAALCAMLLGSALLERHMPWNAPHWLLLCQIGLGAAGYLLARLPDVARLFVSGARATEMASEQALQEFVRLGLRETRGRTGVLLFVSLFEHRVVVLGDEGIDARAGAETWGRAKDAVLAGAARGELADGLVAGVRACGEVLAAHFPRSPDDANEVPDRLVVRAR